jgi:hypothetical protein
VSLRLCGGIVLFFALFATFAFWFGWLILRVLCALSG